ncbi:hypothetical protein BN2476_210042 [Paraburkholderia piptadeniae]|uniref:Uncharacterized protein n=1 Tax=Paraburkholderia piptadeniae TaxID=1701573 RepID=A0A1N7RWF6_9BURK|nr:hypothetical protein BN2476_210042 [Paraburkholderia piptadeniae]
MRSSVSALAPVANLELAKEAGHELHPMETNHAIWHIRQDARVIGAHDPARDERQLPRDV